LSDKSSGPLEHLFSSAGVVHRRNFMAAAAAVSTMSAAGAAVAATTPADAVTEQDREHMRQAIGLMRQAGVVDRTGGPFGAVIVRDGQVLAASGNSVLRDSDPSAHAEVNAIRAACKKAGSPNIKGAVMYTSCECCPMCYATAYWARIDKIYYAAAWTDYADLFDDSNIATDMKRPYAERTVKLGQIMQADAQKVWLEYRNLPQKTRY
jgi:guanine deaminase